MPWTTINTVDGPRELYFIQKFSDGQALTVLQDRARGRSDPNRERAFQGWLPRLLPSMTDALRCHSYQAVVEAPSSRVDVRPFFDAACEGYRGLRLPNGEHFRKKDSHAKAAEMVDQASVDQNIDLLSTPNLSGATKILLVDDIFAHGRTMLAMERKLRVLAPDAEFHYVVGLLIDHEHVDAEKQRFNDCLADVLRQPPIE